MQKITAKINNLWARYRQWGRSSFLGDIVVNIVRVIFTASILLALFYILFITGPFSEKANQYVNNTTGGNCSVAGFNFHGSLLTYIPNHSENDSSNEFDFDTVSSEDIVWFIEKANNNPSIKAILIEVDSGGGSPLAGSEISDAIKQSQKPVIAFIRSVGASAAYWSISSSDKIFASKISDVGGIGITSSYISRVNKNKKDGYSYEQLISGKFKDAGSPEKVLTDEERALIMRDNKIIYENFIQAVSQNRNIPIDKVRVFADGSTVLGDKAKELGLIDDIGNFYDAMNYIGGLIGEEPVICSI